ncbi:hypothetical protein HW561_18670 [Rhodobacteraceae bacterium B1Z28]|uniref:Uncharacterized protein n=1 Tax=Ruegeria haliotis TaxID=2747601 RepID=A0ABX2PUG4_9RHOB|nr:hypothetical protein [Ruegeria haliotis]NVO57825.1 hypothetical protein [Ruegeria haliotis]
MTNLSSSPANAVMAAPDGYWSRRPDLRPHFPAIERNTEMSVYQSPGCADQGVSEAALAAWNARLKTVIDGHGVSPFLVADPRDIDDGQTSAGFRWPGNPREPLDCLGEDLAARLSDLGWASRAELHNEYLEYALVMRPDHSGRLRPKRFIATTELMEWWMTMAVFDLEYFLNAVATITRRTYSSNELFGMTPEAWNTLEISARVACFHRRLVGAGREHPPEHPLNIEHVLFMAKGMNGLNDLAFAMHFSSFPYFVVDGGKRRRARLDEIFAFGNRQDLFCRNAVSRAAQGVYNLAFIEGSDPPQGRAIAFADPLGMYMQAFPTSHLFIDQTEVPVDWLRFSRGSEEMPMRLEFGPGDDDPRFLDEVTLGTGASARPISGYCLAHLIQVGPLVKATAKPRMITKVEFVEIPSVEPGGIICGLPGTERCKQISEFADQCESSPGVGSDVVRRRDG